MKGKPDLASTLLNVFDEDNKRLFGEEKAKKIRENINSRLIEKNLKPINWHK